MGWKAVVNGNRLTNSDGQPSTRFGDAFDLGREPEWSPAVALRKVIGRCNTADDMDPRVYFS